jgi:hypothetical protein
MSKFIHLEGANMGEVKDLKKKKKNEKARENGKTHSVLQLICSY